MGKGGSESMYGDPGAGDVKSVSVAGGTPKQALVAVVLFAAGLVIGVLVGGSGGDSAASASAPLPDPVPSVAQTSGEELNTWGQPKVTDVEREDRAMASFDDEVVQMLAGMTLEQKVGQTTQFNIDETFNSFGNGLPTDDGQPGFADQPQFTDAPWDMMDEDLVRRPSICSYGIASCTTAFIFPHRVCCGMQIRAYTKAPHYVGSWLNSPFSGDAIHTGTDGALRSGLTPTEWRRVLRKIQDITIEDGSPPVRIGCSPRNQRNAQCLTSVACA
jgi:hypothetical protein